MAGPLIRDNGPRPHQPKIEGGFQTAPTPKPTPRERPPAGPPSAPSSSTKPKAPKGR